MITRLRADHECESDHEAESDEGAYPTELIGKLNGRAVKLTQPLEVRTGLLIINIYG